MAIGTTETRQNEGGHALSVIRLLLSGAGTGAVVFVLCWLGTLLPFGSPTHGYIPLFTNAEISSGRALLEGTSWSLLFGGLVSALFAAIYNRLGATARR
jgi:hypothetical protein